MFESSVNFDGAVEEELSSRLGPVEMVSISPNSPSADCPSPDSALSLNTEASFSTRSDRIELDVKALRSLWNGLREADEDPILKRTVDEAVPVFTISRSFSVFR